MSLSELGKIFTPKQINDLQKAGFESLYDFITYLPFDLQEVNPLEAYPKEGSWYLWQGELIAQENKYGKKPFIKLTFSDGSRNIQTYLFTRSKFVLAKLKSAQEYQVLVRYSNSFWQLDRLEPVKDLAQVDKFILGRAKIQKYILPKYQRLGTLTQSHFRTMHKKLDRSHYLLDFKGLIPNNKILPEVLDLSLLHHPQSGDQFNNTLKQWLAFKAFLKIVTFKYWNEKKDTQMALTPPASKEFLKKITSNLDFELSPSQKLTIWELLNEVSVIS